MLWVRRSLMRQANYMKNESLIIVKPFIGNYPISFKFMESPSWYVNFVGYPHNGLDFALPIGVPVLACSDGVVTFADDIPDRNGCGINIVHEWGLSQYWHLNSLNVRQGVKVVAGQTIGASGNTGFTTGPHLHFGVKVKGVNIEGMRGWADPEKYIRKEETIIPPVVPKKRTHIVRPGDTLWKIACDYYGKGWLWTKIYEENKNHIANPNVIRPLQILTIPVA